MLVEAGLTVSDLPRAGVQLLGVRINGQLRGLVGVEVHGEDGLLRSLVVSEASRKGGCGRTLVTHAEEWAARQGVRTLYLLTTTAAAYFERLGYGVVPRSEAPPAIAATAQFTSLCPASSTFMRKALAAAMIVSHDEGIEPLAPPVTGEVRRIAAGVRRIVAPNPGALTGAGTNTYLVGTQRPVVIDPGPDDEAHLERILEATGGSIDRILCTHSHPDHSPGAATLRERTGARVYGQPAPDDGYQDDTYAPDGGLAQGERIDAGGIVLRAIHTPGHASNHVCLLAEASGMLFTGDHLMTGTTVVILPPDGSMRLYVESLRQLRTLPLGCVAPGHGAVIPDAIAEIDRVVAHRLQREAKLVAAFARRGRARLEEVLPEVYDDVPKFMHVYARFSLQAHAIKLEEEGRATRDGDVYRWLGG